MKRTRRKRDYVSVTRLANFDGTPCRPDKTQFEPDLEESEKQSENDQTEHRKMLLRAINEYELLLKLESGEIVLEALAPYFKVQYRSSVLRIIRRHFVRLRKQWELPKAS